MTIADRSAQNSQAISDEEFEALEEAHFFMKAYMQRMNEPRNLPWWEKVLGVFGIRRIVR